MEDFAYTISDTAKDLNADAFMVEPSFCEVDYVASVSKFADGDSAVTIESSQLEFIVDYIASLDPAINIETQTVTIKATSKTMYSDPASSPNSASDSFEVTFLNPCIDQNFVTIEGPTSLKTLEYVPEEGPVTFDAHSDF